MNWKRTGDTPICIEHERNGVHYFTFPALEKLAFVEHLFTTRLGGVSTGDCATMNLNFDREPDREPVLQNYRIIGEILGLKPEEFVLSHQTHTTNVRLVTEKDKGKGVVRERDYENVDGLITDTPGIGLVTIYADCVPLFFADPVKKAVGVSHSGWKGTVSKMGVATVDAMKKHFGTNPSDLVCVIAPSICQDCYEVSRDVAERFSEVFGSEGILLQKSSEKYQLNLWEANKRVLLEAGVKEENIQVTDICTCCNPKLLFSHRASKGRRGNLAAVIKIK